MYSKSTTFLMAPKGNKNDSLPPVTPEQSGYGWNCKSLRVVSKGECILMGCSSVTRMYEHIPNMKIKHMTRADRFTWPEADSWLTETTAENVSVFHAVDSMSSAEADGWNWSERSRFIRIPSWWRANWRRARRERLVPQVGGVVLTCYGSIVRIPGVQLNPQLVSVCMGIPGSVTCNTKGKVCKDLLALN